MIIIKKKINDQEISYISLRYSLSIAVIILEILAIIVVVTLLTIYIPYFYIFVIITSLAITFKIMASADNANYKVPWIIVVLLLPIAGFMLYFMFYERKLTKKQVKIMNNQKEIIKKNSLNKKREKDKLNFYEKIADSNIYQNTTSKYFPSGEEVYQTLINDLKSSKKSILIEMFIIKEGKFFNEILDILIEKAQSGVDVKLIYDDVGCMTYLEGDFYKELRKKGIESYVFCKLKGANDGFNNRSHRKLIIIDGKIAYSGGINLADEYINLVEVYGYWKDAYLRLEGDAVLEMINIFAMNYALSSNKTMDPQDYFTKTKVKTDGYYLPFEDGPKPFYEHNVFKEILLNSIYNAKTSIKISSPYLVIDDEIRSALMRAAFNDVKIDIIIPKIPDKMVTYLLTCDNAELLKSYGINFYVYTPGFNHLKLYLFDDNKALVGTSNLDYRSMVHNFENGIVLYESKAVDDMVKDYAEMISKSIEYKSEKKNLFKSAIVTILKLFSPLF